MTATPIQIIILGHVVIATVVTGVVVLALQYLIEKVYLRHGGTKAEVETLAPFRMVGDGPLTALLFLLSGVRACRARHLPNRILMGRPL